MEPKEVYVKCKWQEYMLRSDTYFVGLNVIGSEKETEWYVVPKTDVFTGSYADGLVKALLIEQQIDTVVVTIDDLMRNKLVDVRLVSEAIF